MRAWALAACFVMAVGCTTRPATQIIVEIDAESGVRNDLDVVHIRVNGGDGSTVGAPAIQRLDVRERPPRWPFTVVIAPLDRDPERRYEVVVTAEGAQPAVGERPVVARVRAISGFVPGETRVLRLLLEDACRGQVCGDDQTCRRGTCQSAVVDPTTLGSLNDAGASSDASSPDAGSGDASSDAGPGDASSADAASATGFTPRNLPATVWSSATGSIVVMTSATVDTDSGVVLVDGASSRGFTPIDVDPVADCAGILAIATGSFRVAAGATVNVTGSRGLAIVATGPIVIDGLIDVGARGRVGGPGSLVRRGGGGYGSEGGLGGCDTAGGIVPTFGNAELTGLCGGSTSTAGAGGGGGALELVSALSVEIGAAGVVRAVGGGGADLAAAPYRGNGGSGGAVLVQAPTVRVAGTVSVNGGGGAGGYGAPGTDGQVTAGPAAGAAEATRPIACGSATSGAGGAGAWQNGAATAGRPGVSCSTAGCSEGGAGGGGAGRIRIDLTTRDYVEGRVLEYPGLPGVFTEGTL